MKILVATKKGQGLRANDFCFVPEKEPVRFTIECDDEGPDGSCGCKRCMSGMTTRVGTTTFTVINVAMTKEKYFRMVRKSYKDGGWLKYGVLKDEDIRRESEDLLRLAKAFLPGEILEKRGPTVQAREVKKRK